MVYAHCIVFGCVIWSILHRHNVKRDMIDKVLGMLNRVSSMMKMLNLNGKLNVRIRKRFLQEYGALPLEQTEFQFIKRIDAMQITAARAAVTTARMTCETTHAVLQTIAHRCANDVVLTTRIATFMTTIDTAIVAAVGIDDAINNRDAPRASILANTAQRHSKVAFDLALALRATVAECVRTGDPTAHSDTLALFDSHIETLLNDTANAAEAVFILARMGQAVFGDTEHV